MVETPGTVQRAEPRIGIVAVGLLAVGFWGTVFAARAARVEGPRRMTACRHAAAGPRFHRQPPPRFHGAPPRGFYLGPHRRAPWHPRVEGRGWHHVGPQPIGLASEPGRRMLLRHGHGF
jgi:hypothetical protein